MAITLGTEGNQPFKIKAEGVSRKHARITIDDNNQWYLEDLDSANGTFVRDEKNGELIRIAKTMISPMSFICLGPDNSNGCTFYARQVLENNSGNFREEYEYLNAKEDEFDQKLEQLETIVLYEKKLVFAINVLVVIVSLIPQIDSEIRMNLLRVVPVVSTAFAAFYDASGRKKKINSIREKFHHCPNPACSNKLKASQIRNMKCSKCKK